MKYKMVSESNIYIFNREVNRLIKKGFRTWGSPHVSEIQEESTCRKIVLYSQALKEEY